MFNFTEEYYHYHPADDSRYSDGVIHCRSEVEKLLYGHLEARRPADMNILPQVKVPCNGKSVTLDFVISLIKPDTFDIRPLFAVECDGLEHRPAKDKARDRSLISLLDLPVVRFTNAEVQDDPENCAEEVMKIFDQRKGILISPAFPQELINPTWLVSS